MTKIICLCGLSASGKDTILQRVSYDLKIKPIVSHTSRPMRPSELDSVNYHFVSDSFFDDNKEEFIEQRLYKVKNANGSTSIWRYGIHESSINEGLNIVIVDPPGRDDLIEYYGKENIITFYIYASDETRLKRLNQRGDTSNMEEVNRRLKFDKQQFDSFINERDYIKICNEDNLDLAVQEIENIINSLKL